jgi:hypothetical protein
VNDKTICEYEGCAGPERSRRKTIIGLRFEDIMDFGVKKIMRFG